MSGVVGLIMGIGLRIGRRSSNKIALWSDVPDWIFIVVGACALFFAGYQAWQDEHMARIAEHATVLQLSSPNLHIQVLQLAFGDTSHKVYTPTVLVWLSVSNTGTDSVATSYTFLITLRNKKQIKGRPLVVPDTLTFEEIGTFLPEAGKSALYDKTVEQPIPRGGQRQGILLFALDPSVPLSQYEEGGVSFEVSCIDVTNKRYAISFPVKGNGDQVFKYFPGTSPATTIRKKP